MGVPLLLTWLRKRFTSCFIPANSTLSDPILHPDNLYVDLNSFLYQAASIVENLYQRERSAHSADGDETESYGFSATSSSTISTEEIESLVLDHLYQLLDDVILQVVQPVRMVYLAVDGVSPLGKLAQQRSRRHRRAVKPPHFAAASRHGGGVPFSSQWDSNCISVGTKFMHKAAQALHQYAVMRTESVNLQRLKEAEPSTSSFSSSASPPFIPIVFVVDDVFRPGEGETKISEAIRRFRLSPTYDPNTSHVICSSDTDVTVTSLLLHDPHIHVLRYEPPPLLSAGGGGGGRGGGRGRGGRGGRGGGRGYHGGHFHAGNASSFSARGRGGFSFSSSSSSSFSPRRTDPLTSTFFSIHLFREALRELLSLAPASTRPSTVGNEGHSKNVQEEEEEKHPKGGGGHPTASSVPSPLIFNIDPLSSESRAFEKSLHDIVFLLLLFGNDFLPSVSGSIQEGTLDALLTLLAEDFVPRQRYIVDSATNLINFDAARYLLTRLLEIRQDLHPGRLEIYAGSSSSDRQTASPMPSGTPPPVTSAATDASTPDQARRPLSTGMTAAMRGGSRNGEGVELDGIALPGVVPSSWGYLDDPEYQRRLYQRERVMRKKCYCYWTMLQWALHYSAGEVKHWGCYYPFSMAPPLDKLSEYCGVISYPQLRTFADRQASSGAASVLPTAPLHDMVHDNILSFALDGHPVSHGSDTPSHGEGEEEDRGEPTDVLVQLLVLLPPQSAPLLPTRFQHCYGEIERMVNAPMEHIDFHAVLAWCDTHEKLLSESDQTRFLAYRFLSHSSLLYASAPGVDTTRSGTPSSAVASPTLLPLRSRDILFMASWNAEAVTREVEKMIRCTSATSPAALRANHHEEKGSDTASSGTENGPPEGTTPLPSLLSRTSQWTRRFPSSRGGMKSATPSAAAAAVLHHLVPLPPTPPTHSTTTTTRVTSMVAPHDNDGVPDAMHAHRGEEKHFLGEDVEKDESTTPESTSIDAKVELPLVPCPTIGGDATPTDASLPPVVVRETASYAFHVGPLALLGQELLQKSMGQVDGYHFRIHDFHSSSSSTSGVLSRHADTHQTRLLWELAATIPEPEEKQTWTGLLPGVVFPNASTAHRKRGRSGDREEERVEKQSIPEVDPLTPLPFPEARVLSIDGNEQDRKEKEKGDGEVAAVAVSEAYYPNEVAVTEEKQKALDQQIRRDALRRRLEMLKNAAKEE